MSSPAPDDVIHEDLPATRATDAEADELVRLRAEVSVLRQRLDTGKRRSRVVTRARGMIAAILVMLAGFGFVASVVGLWAANTTLRTDRWVDTVASLPKDPQVAAAVAEYSTTALFDVLSVEARLKEALPERAAFVAGPITGQVRDYVQKTVNNVLRSDRFQPLWIELNRRAHAQALAILEGRSAIVSASGRYVTIDLLPVINQVLRELSAQLPTLFGRQISLPDISSGEIPANLRATVENAVGVQLPANFAQFRVYDGGKLRTVQLALLNFKRSLAALVIGTVLLLGLALLISPRRRRTLLQLGLWLVIAAVAVTASLRTVRSQLLEQVPAGTYRNGAASTLTTVTAVLRERGQQVIWLGVIIAVLAYLVGPGRIPVWLRHRAAALARKAGRGIGGGGRLAAAQGPGWIARHLDAARVGGVIVAAVFALVLSSWTGLLVIALLLAGFELVVTLVGRAGRSRIEGTPLQPEARSIVAGPAG